MGEARTALPAAVFDHYEYWFTKSEEAAVKVDPSGGVFGLVPGLWTVTVKAFAETADNSLAAEGTSASFTISAGGDAGTIPVTVHPVVSEGTGDLSYTLTYPAGVTVDSFTLTLLAGSAPVDLTSGATTGGTGLTGNKTALAAGYYLAQADLTKTANGTRAGKEEVVHIYKNMTTSLAWNFSNAYFTAIPVVSNADSGPGTLREAINSAAAGNTIFIDLPEDGVITLTSPLTIDKNLTIAGNGAVLTQSGFTVSSSSQLLRISGSGVTVRISRLHFTGGQAILNGAAINNSSSALYLESCVFSRNETDIHGAYSGAGVWNSGTLSVSGCTFYQNRGGIYGGAIYNNASGTLTLTGNVFWGNIAENGNVVYSNGGAVNTGGYNVSDMADGTDNTTGSGWTFTATDTQASVLPISGLTFKPLQGSEALNLITARPAGYPLTDFYGRDILYNNAAGGAVQTPVTGSGYYLELSVNDSLRGSLTVSPLPDEDGLAGSFTLTATPGSEHHSFGYWLVNGARTENAPTSIYTHTFVQAVFNRLVTVDNFTDDIGSASAPGTLRYTLASAQTEDIISFSGVNAGTTVVELQSALPVIAQSIAIVGNGVTLTRASSWTTVDSTSRLLTIETYDNSVAVSIHGVHFKNGLATDFGGAIRNIGTGILTLESCIFSGNHVSSGGFGGGAIYSNNTLTLRGCTFYGNTTTDQGGAGAAVNFYAPGKTLTLTGNLFYGNTAPYTHRPVVFQSYSSPDGIVNASYNVVDVDFGIGDNQCGWTAGPGDTQVSALPISPESFRPLSSYMNSSGILIVPANTPEFPATDFYGAGRTIQGAAGAVAHNEGGGSTSVYAITFEANGGIPVPENQIVAVGCNATEPAMTKTGYIFDGWYTEAALTNQWNFTTDTVTADITLYAGWNAMTVSTPDAPVVAAGNTQLTVSWETVTGAAVYEVRIGTSNDPAYSSQYGGDMNGLTATITGLVNGTTYYVWIKAKNSVYDSLSPAASGKPIGNMGTVTLTPGANQLIATWAAVPGADQYRVYYGTSTTMPANSTDTTAAAYYHLDGMFGLNNGTGYYVWVRPENVNGTGGVSTRVRGYPAGWTVSTLAGSGDEGYADGTGAAAQFHSPAAVAVYGTSTVYVYVADTANNCIRRVASNGTVTTIGPTDYFYEPRGVAVNGAGIYVADAGECRIIRMSSSGAAPTVLAGEAYGYADGTGAAAEFTDLKGMAVDNSGNIYVVDGHRIRKITPAGVVTTLAGSTTAGYADGTGAAAKFSSPNGVAVDSSGNVYVADTDNNRIRKITSGGVVTTLAGSGNSGSGFELWGYYPSYGADGPATAAIFFNPSGVAVDSTGNVYVLDNFWGYIRRITPGGVVTTLAGQGNDYADGIGRAARFAHPQGMAMDSSGNIYVADGNQRIRKATP